MCDEYVNELFMLPGCPCVCLHPCVCVTVCGFSGVILFHRFLSHCLSLQAPLRVSGLLVITTQHRCQSQTGSVCEKERVSTVIMYISTRSTVQLGTVHFKPAKSLGLSVTNVIS